MFTINLYFRHILNNKNAYLQQNVLKKYTEKKASFLTTQFYVLSSKNDKKPTSLTTKSILRAYFKLKKCLSFVPTAKFINKSIGKESFLTTKRYATKNL